MIYYSTCSFTFMSLDDVQVVDEMIFKITGDNQYTLDWPEYGLQINIPSGSLPPGCRAELQIKSIVAGNFILPPDCHLVSSIYWIGCPERFEKKATLSIRHAAIIESLDEAFYFRFYAAKCSSGPPYKFKELKNAVFTFFDKSACVKLSQFSFVAGGSTNPPRQRYYSRVFYKSIQPYLKWDMFFVMTKEDPAFQMVNHLFLILCYLL